MQMLPARLVSALCEEDFRDRRLLHLGSSVINWSITPRPSKTAVAAALGASVWTPALRPRRRAADVNRSRVDRGATDSACLIWRPNTLSDKPKMVSSARSLASPAPFATAQLASAIAFFVVDRSDRLIPLGSAVRSNSASSKHALARRKLRASRRSIFNLVVRRLA